MAVLGDIALVGFRSDDPDSMAFVLLADLSGETISFTDNGWLSAGGFRTGEGTFSYTVPANTPIGTVVTLTSVGASSFSTGGDQIIAYVGTAANPTFLFALDFADGNTSFATNATSSNTSAVPTGLTAGTNALAFAFDNGAYTGSLSGTRAEILANIANPANWTTNDTTGVTYPGNFTITGGGVSAQVTINDISITEADAGTSLLTFTVTRSDASGAFSVDYATADGTATAGSDYVAATGTLTFTAGGALSQTVSITITGDTLAEANETLSVGLSNIVNSSGTAAISDATGIGTITNDDISLVAINAIQGAAHTSPLVGQVVTTRGIVTAVDTNGFYIQAADADVDGNDATSEAILVFTGSIPTVALGDRVQVSGTVTEFVPGGNTSGNLSTTQLTGPTVSVLSSGNALPTAIVLGAGGRAAPTEIIDNDNFGTFDPASDGIDFYESLEGMRVTIPAPLVVAPTTSFGEIYTVADGGIGATGLSARGTIVTKGSVGDGLNVTNTGAGSDYNPERIQIDGDSFTLGLIPNVAAGTRLNDVTGIVSYGFGSYEVLATSAVTIASASILTGEVTNLDGDADTLTIASYNVLNLDPNDADGDTDIADGRFTSIALQIVNALGTPDIVALQEIQDNSGSANDGTVSASLTLQTLVDAIAANGGPTYSFIDNPFITNNANGGQPGGNIRVAYLYDAARVTLVAGSVATTTNAATDFVGSRQPLVATFEFNNENVTVINNHFSSKGGSSSLFGSVQPSTNGSAADRLVQAQNVANYVTSLGAAAKVVVLGDLNEFTNEESLAPLGAAGLSAMSLTLAETERYSYSFEGNAQELDQVYVSGNLTGIATLDIVHVNSEFVQTATSASDHDPSVLAINIAAPAPAPFAAGDIAFVGFNADGNDDLAFVALREIAAGTVIYFNDREWTGAGFNTGEGELVWTASSTVAAGTIVSINNFGSTPVSNLGTTSSSSGLSTTSEIVYAYVGAPGVPTAFLAAIANNGFTADGGTLSGTGLVAGTTAIDLSTVDVGADIGVFNGARNGQASYAGFLAQINNAANWLTQDTAADDSVDASAPNLPFSVAGFTLGGAETQSVGFENSSVPLAEGNAGTTAFTFTVVRTGGTTGAVDFVGSFAAGDTNAADFAGAALPTGFNGTIAAGATSATVTINVAGDASIEATEGFGLTLTSVTNSAGVATSIQSGIASATGTVINDDLAPAAFGPGDVAFVGFNADGNDNLALAAIKALPSGTVLYFSDNEWNGTGWTDLGESAFALTLTSNVAAGTIFTIDNVTNAASTSSNVGTVASISAGGSNRGIAGGTEQVYVYIAEAGSPLTPTAFLAAVSNEGFATLGLLTGTGLAVGTTALDLGLVDAGADIGAYNGSRSNQTSFAAYLPVLNNAANWVVQDAGGDQSIDTIFPDVPFSGTALSLAAAAQIIGFATASLTRSVDEGNAGTKAITFTVERSGGTTGQLDFAGSIAAGSSDAADFGGVLPSGFSGSIAAGAASATVTVIISGDISVETNENFSLMLTGGSNPQTAGVLVSGTNATATATIVNDDFPLAIGGINLYGAAPSLAGSTATPVASNDLVLVHLGSIQGTVAGAESIAYENGKVYSTNIAGNAINVHSVTAAGSLVNEAPISLVGLPSYLTGGVNSVDVKNGIIAVGYENTNPALPGFVALFNAADNSLIKTIQVGILPDDVTFTPDGLKLLVANEGEALSALGTISIIDLSGGTANAVVTNTISFASLNGAEAALRDRGVAVAAGQPAAGDIEPEYITISADGTRAYVTLQEVNSVAVIDLTNPTADRPLSIQPLGTVDFSLPGNAIDPSDQDGAGGVAAINIRNIPVQGLLQPDAIATFDVGGVTYFVTANEGDSRVNVTDLVRLNSSGYVLDPTAFPNAAALKANANLGRLNVSTVVGDTDGDGDFDVIHTIGGRGISIFRQNADGTITKVRETGGEFEAITAAAVPGSFNSNQSVTGFDSRSDDKGPEPEGVSIGVVNGRTYAFVGLERVGGYMVYDVTDPANASFVSYRPQTALDRGPETSAFVSAANSPTGQALLLSAQEISNTVTLYSIQTQSEGNDTINGGTDAESWNGRGGNDSIAGNGGNDSIDGGAGTDTARFTGAWVGYDVTVSGTIVTDIDTANGNDGTDTLTSVELLSFAGVSVAAADAINDAPIGVNDNNAGDALVEDSDATAFGNVLNNDTDADAGLGLGETKTVTGARAGSEAGGGTLDAVAAATVINGIYGQLTINPDGNWSYALDNARAATQALLASQTATESFTYRVTDAHGLTDTAQIDLAIGGAAEPYRLQILHLSDGEAGLLAPTTAPLLAALFDKFEDLVPNSITIAGGDTFIPGPFLAGGTDPSLNAVLNAVAGTTFAASAVVPIAAVDTAIHNIIGVEVSGIGNHEWDLGSNVYQASITPNSVAGWTGANYVSLTANLNFNPGGGIPADAINGRFTQTVGVGGLEEASSLKGRVAPSAVVTENGEKIGFVGVTTQVLEAISSPTGAEVIGFPFGPGPNGEVDNMALLAAQLQPVIDDLRNQGVNKIVLLSHLQLLNNEKTLAPLLKGVDIILAAGSNTRLGDANDTAVAFPGHGANFADTYPLVLTDADGKTTLIVNTDNEYTYLGRLIVDFDANGDIILSSLAANTTINGAYAATVDTVAAAYGVNAADVYTSDAFGAGSKGARVKALADAVSNVIQVKDGNVFGFSNVYLEGDRTAVRTEESNLGNVTADANADALRDALGLGASDPVISIKNGGGVRAQIGSLVNNPDGTVTKVGPGSVSQLDVENSLRFDNALIVFDTTAQGIKAILEHSVSQTAPGATPGRFGQIGGISLSFNPTAAVGSRVSDIAIINEDNQIIATLYDNGVLQAGVPTVIKAVTLNFLANGGDSYPMKANGENFRYLLNDGTLGPILDEAQNFESARPANALGEIRALQEYFGERYATPETAFNQADTPAAGDLRIQNAGVRTDTVLAADYFLNGNALANNVVGNDGDNLLQGFGGNDNINGRGGNDTAAYAGAWVGYDVSNGGATVTDINAGNGNDGTDTLNNVEFLRFAGVVVATAAAVNDAPIGVNDNNTGDALVEDSDATAFGNVLNNDTDADASLGLGETKTVTGARAGSEAGGGTLDAVAAAKVINGIYGQLTINPDGNWSYALDNARAATQALLASQTATESFTYRVTDAHGLTDTAQIDLAIGGAYDAGDALTGTPGSDVITGSVLGETLNGLGGNDNINGNGGNDMIDGGAGNDVINGGQGSDTASYASATNGVTVRLSLTFGQNTGNGIDTLSGIENLLGSGFDDLLFGDIGANRIDGGVGNDALFGSRGDDTLVNGLGNDLFEGGVGADTFLFDTISNGAVDVITDFYASQGDTLSFGAGVTVTAAYVGFITTGSTVNGQATDNSSRALDLVVTLSSADGSQTVHILDAYNYASNDYWEGMLGIDLSYPEPLPSGTTLVMIA